MGRLPFGYPGGVLNVIINILLKGSKGRFDYWGRKEGHVTEAAGSRVRERRCFADGLKEGGRHCELRHVIMDIGKGKEMSSFLGSPEGAQPC